MIPIRRGKKVDIDRSWSRVSLGRKNQETISQLDKYTAFPFVFPCEPSCISKPFIIWKPTNLGKFFMTTNFRLLESHDRRNGSQQIFLQAPCIPLSNYSNKGEENKKILNMKFYLLLNLLSRLVYVSISIILE